MNDPEAIADMADALLCYGVHVGFADKRAQAAAILVGDGVDAVLTESGSPYADGIIDATPKSASIRSLSVASMGRGPSGSTW